MRAVPGERATRVALRPRDEPRQRSRTCERASRDGGGAAQETAAIECGHGSSLRIDRNGVSLGAPRPRVGKRPVKTT